MRTLPVRVRHRKRAGKARLGAWAVQQGARVQLTGASASRMAVRSSSSSKGLARNADAPALSAVERISGSSFPVKMITRVEGEILPSREDRKSTRLNSSHVAI